MKTLTQRLDELRAGSSERIPAEEYAIMQRATRDLQGSGILSRLPLAGSSLPAFELADSAGAPVRSEDLLSRGPLVLAFYRGLW